MRLWSLHPRYLDSRGLVALWREALLARAVLQGRTRGYRHHPQLLRFRDGPDPVASLNSYLAVVYAEAARRGYRFDVRKLGARLDDRRLETTRGQLTYEWAHLLRKLGRRAPPMANRWRGLIRPRPHPLFRIVPGGPEPWEVLRRRA